jgi:hypothetical protein
VVDDLTLRSQAAGRGPAEVDLELRGDNRGPEYGPRSERCHVVGCVGDDAAVHETMLLGVIHALRKLEYRESAAKLDKAGAQQATEGLGSEHGSGILDRQLSHIGLLEGTGYTASAATANLAPEM